MKKFGVLATSFILLTLPAIASANIKALDGLTVADQFLATTTGATTMHMQIISALNKHTFQWDATPWRVDQGGTGTTTYANGSLLFYSNSKITEDNGNLFWDTLNKFFGVGTSAPTQKLEVAGNVKLSGTLFANLLNITGNSTLSGRVGIGNSNPQHALDVAGAIYSRLVTAVSDAIDWNAGNVQSLTLASPSTVITLANGQAGGEYKLILNQDSTGGRTVSWSASIKWPNGVTPTLTSSANAIDTASFVNDGSSYLGSFTPNYLATSSQADCTGGTIMHSGGRTIHTFTTSGTFDCSAGGAKTADLLVIGGGGQGGQTTVGGAGVGGGGAGGFQYVTSHALAANSYPVTVGAGGSGAGVNAPGASGATSSIDTIASNGGGGGGGFGGSNINGVAGGSGGGAGWSAGTAGTGNSPSTSPSQGNSGGSSGDFSGGGGGGASAVGGSFAGSAAGSGGNGTANSITGASVIYAGGGGGGSDAGQTAGSGGSGGGGAGGQNGGSNPVAGTVNTGGGGGGGGTGSTPNNAGAAGGSGIVMVSYTTP